MPRFAAPPAQTIDGFLPNFVTQGSVQAKKDALAPDFDATNASVVSSTSLAPSARDAWSRFYAAWQAFHAKEVGWWSVTSEDHETDDYARRLADWQATLATAGVTIVSPVVVPPPQDDASPIKWIAGAVIAVAVTVAVVSVAGPLVAARKR